MGDSYKWIGSILIIGSCGGFGISLAVHQKREVQLISQLCRIIDEMLWELPFQLTPLPELILHAVGEKGGMLGSLFYHTVEQLNQQVLPDVRSCMEASLPPAMDSFPRLKSCLLLLGSGLGRFDLSGQLKGLSAVRKACTQALRELNENRDARLRGYRILGLCAGISLAILLI